MGEHKRVVDPMVRAKARYVARYGTTRGAALFDRELAECREAIDEAKKHGSEIVPKIPAAIAGRRIDPRLPEHLRHSNQATKMALFLAVALSTSAATTPASAAAP